MVVDFHSVQRSLSKYDTLYIHTVHVHTHKHTHTHMHTHAHTQYTSTHIHTHDTHTYTVHKQHTHTHAPTIPKSRVTRLFTDLNHHYLCGSLKLFFLSSLTQLPLTSVDCMTAHAAKTCTCTIKKDLFPRGT